MVQFKLAKHAVSFWIGEVLYAHVHAGVGSDILYILEVGQLRVLYTNAQ